MASITSNLPDGVSSTAIPAASPRPAMTWSEFETQHPDEAQAADDDVLRDRLFREFMDAPAEEFHAAAMVLREAIRAARREAIKEARVGRKGM